jgi:peptide/nickel transport system permease protein
MVTIAIAAPLLTPYSPVQADLRNYLEPPAWAGGTIAHPIGTDTFGRDVLSRLLFGARVSLSVALFSLLIATTMGALVGLTAGYLGGAIDSVLMRFVDMVLALPTVLMALAIAIALGPSYTNMILIIGFMIWPRTARLLRAETMLLKQQEFARYARAVGVPGWLIVLRHVLPNVMPTLLVAVTLEVGHVILLEATLSFLGAGIPPPQPSWGVMVADGRALIGTGWWIALFPGLAIMVTVMSCNLLGDWLRDHFDPKFREV